MFGYTKCSGDQEESRNNQSEWTEGFKGRQHLPRCPGGSENSDKMLQMKQNHNQGRLNLGVISAKAHELTRIDAAAGRKI